MQLLSSLRNRIPSLALVLSLLSTVLLTACGPTRNPNTGAITTAGVLHLALALFAFMSLLKQDWSGTKKIIWGLLIWFFPFGGSILYFLFSGRS